MPSCSASLPLPVLRWQVYHREKPLLRRLFLTIPGWCTILSTLFFFANTYFVVRTDVLGLDDTGGGQDRACAPIAAEPDMMGPAA